LVERGTLLIKHIFGGTSRIIPFWAGLGLEERNFLGRGLTLGISAVGTAEPQIMGGRSQAAFEAYTFLPSTFKLPVFAGVHFNRGSEFYQTYGDSGSGDPANFLSMHYLSFGLKAKTYFPVGPFFLHLGFDSNLVLADIPSEAVRHLEDGRTKNIDFGLNNGLSAISVFFMKLIYDSRNRPVLPSSGSLVELSARSGSPLTLSNYTFLKAEFLASRFFAMGSHAFSLHLYGASMMGNLPLFEKIYIGDVQDLIPQRALGLNLSVAPSPNIMNTGISDIRWGTAAVKATMRYDYTFYQGEAFVYRANFFISGGMFMLSTATRLRYREGGFWETAPIDLTANFGVHLDTRLGIFSLSISNVIGRLPL
ncbi:BamA/TamA family outer membrane protein, partial [Myxococcota bacterium]|nr:BamA/TamA family outer membrane protein [Myxococcota bacterium]